MGAGPGPPASTTTRSADMDTSRMLHRWTKVAVAATAGLALSAGAQEMKIELSGKNEVPPVATRASGNGTFAVKPDGTITGAVTTAGIEATMAHIHEGAEGENGPVRIPLVKDGDRWAVPSGTKLDDARRQALEQGRLYVNVHSKEHPGGELRAQLK
ncbi:MAG TPA: CHRD domain-containing protein [Zeimonas sp.]|nr:CHRD domain-containing protein [Zeimonas sp.]